MGSNKAYEGTLQAIKKMSGNIIFTLKSLFLVTHPSLKFQAHISNYHLFLRPSQTAHTRTEITTWPFWQPGGAQQGQRHRQTAPSCRSLLQLAKYRFIWNFQRIIYLAFKLILSKSKDTLFLQKLTPPGFPFLSVMIMFTGIKITQSHCLWHLSPLLLCLFPSYEPSFFFSFLYLSWCLTEPGLTLVPGIWP